MRHSIFDYANYFPGDLLDLDLPQTIFEGPLPELVQAAIYKGRRCCAHAHVGESKSWADEQLDELKHLCRMPVQPSRIRMDVPAPHESAIQRGIPA